MQIPVHIVHAFADGFAGGNPAGVVVDANGLSTGQKLHIAQQVGLSETAFVSASDKATLKLEFFTPTRQIAHCGHATIATFSLLRHIGSVADGHLSKETIDGIRAITVHGDTIYMEQRAPEYHPVALDEPLGQQILNSVGISAKHLLPGTAPTVVSTGNAFLLLPLQDATSVASLAPIQESIQTVSEALDLVGYYVFSPDTRQAGRDAGARMFAPRFGIQEESATGMAAGPLACYLYDVLGTPSTELNIEQGWLMEPPLPSVISVKLTVTNGTISTLMVGGRARVESLMEVSV